MGLVPQYGSLLAQQTAVERQIASGKRIVRADEDPVAVGLAQKLHVDNDRLTQDQTNIDQATAFSQFTSGGIDTATQYMQRAVELAVSAGDATKSATNLQAIGVEVAQLLNGIVDIGSQNYRGRYLMSGSITNQAAFTAVTDATGTITGVTYNGNADQLQTEYAPGRTSAYNLLGSNEKGGDFGILRDVNAGVDIFQTLIDLRDHLNTGNTAALVNDVAQVKAGLEHLTTAAVKAGSTQSRFAANATLHQDQQELLGGTLSQLEDTDVAAAATNLTALRTAYQAALAIGAKVGEVSLLNYLR
jgi:flagellar hook-associated protein 3 FlgL